MEIGNREGKLTRRLGWILGCILLIGILATLAAGIIAGRRALAELDRSAAASATLHNAVFRSELEKFRLVPTALASDPEAVAALRGEASAITSFDRRLEQLSGSIRAAAIYLIDSRGRTIAA